MYIDVETLRSRWWVFMPLTTCLIMDTSPFLGLSFPVYELTCCVIFCFDFLNFFHFLKMGYFVYASISSLKETYFALSDKETG